MARLALLAERCIECDTLMNPASPFTRCTSCIFKLPWVELEFTPETKAELRRAKADAILAARKRAGGS